jgi:hypothetical protein
MVMTRPLQIYLDEREFQALDDWARERGWTKSHAVRAAIRALTRGRDQDPLLKACGMIEGLPEDLSERIDDYLEETFVAEKTGAAWRKPRGSRKRLR